MTIPSLTAQQAEKLVYENIRKKEGVSDSVKERVKGIDLSLDLSAKSVDQLTNHKLLQLKWLNIVELDLTGQQQRLAGMAIVLHPVDIIGPGW